MFQTVLKLCDNLCHFSLKTYITTHREYFYKVSKKTCHFSDVHGQVERVEILHDCILLRLRQVALKNMIQRK